MSEIIYHCKLTEEQKIAVEGVYGTYQIQPRLGVDGFFYCPESCKNIDGLSVEQVAIFESAEKVLVDATTFPEDVL